MSEHAKRPGVAALSPFYTPNFGGAGIQAQRLVGELRRRGWDPFVVTARNPGLAAREKVEGSDVIRVRTWGVTRSSGL